MRGPTTAAINYVAGDEHFRPQEPLFSARFGSSYTYSPQPDGRPQTNERYAPEQVQIQDLRDFPELTLSTAGFQLVHAQTALSENDLQSLDTHEETVKPMDDTQSILKVYHAEIEAIIRQAFSGVKKVLTYNQRTRLHKPNTTRYDFTADQNFPVMRPHIDMTPQSGRDLTEQWMSEAGRVLVVNAWRPIRGIVLDAPLAVTDARSLTAEAMIVNRIIYRDREKTGYSIRDNGHLDWYYTSAQSPSEVLLFKQYDSKYINHTPAHTAFIDTRFDGQPGVLPRYSVETRSIVLLE
ncbi:hypothetical protein IAT38_004760 [Cryptococcus sp. DSM 104549]